MENLVRFVKKAYDTSCRFGYFELLELYFLTVTIFIRNPVEVGLLDRYIGLVPDYGMQAVGFFCRGIRHQAGVLAAQVFQAVQHAYKPFVVLLPKLETGYLPEILEREAQLAFVVSFFQTLPACGHTGLKQCFALCLIS